MRRTTTALIFFGALWATGCEDTNAGGAGDAEPEMAVADLGVSPDQATPGDLGADVSSDAEPDAGSPPDLGAPEGLSCEGLLDCAAACDGRACIDNCWRETSPEGVSDAESMLACAEDRGCLAGRTLNLTCLETACPEEAAACGRPSAGGDLSCEAFSGCLRTCQDQACEEACRRALSVQGTVDRTGLERCIVDSGCFQDGEVDYFCGALHCEAWMVACGLGDLPAPTGQASCRETVDCLVQCAEPECSDACIEAAQLDGAWDASIVARCLGDFMCLSIDECPECADLAASCD